MFLQYCDFVQCVTCHRDPQNQIDFVSDVLTEKS